MRRTIHFLVPWAPSRLSPRKVTVSLNEWTKQTTLLHKPKRHVSSLLVIAQPRFLVHCLCIAVKGKGKEKEMKDASRQTTLFGLPPGPGPEKKGRGRPSKKGGANEVAVTPTPSVPTSKTSSPEPCKITVTEAQNTAGTHGIQATDVTMVDTPSTDNVDQLVPDNQVLLRLPLISNMDR